MSKSSEPTVCRYMEKQFSRIDVSAYKNLFNVSNGKACIFWLVLHANGMFQRT